MGTNSKPGFAPAPQAPAAAKPPLWTAAADPIGAAAIMTPGADIGQSLWRWWEKQKRDRPTAMPYTPTKFSGVQELLKLGKPPGYDRLPPGVEYGVEIPKASTAGGDFSGEATEMVRGRVDGVQGKTPNFGHGNHDSPYASYADKVAFLQRLEADQARPSGSGPVVAPIWTNYGSMSALVSEPVLRTVPQYLDKARTVASPSQPVEGVDGNGAPERSYTPKRATVKEVYFDPSGKQIDYWDAYKLYYNSPSKLKADAEAARREAELENQGYSFAEIDAILKQK